jgi:glutamyl-tRNA synthetase
MPTYHLANIVDDHLMNITHVIRGEEWLPSLALHYQLYTAFCWDKPEFAHLPLILKPTGKGKLSKRDGDKLGFPVFPLEYTSPQGDVSKGYKEDGYFSEAVTNFLAFLGWNPGTEQELFSMEELITAFDLNKVNKAGARFDPDKTKWFNHQYMQQQSNYELAETFKVQHSELRDIDVNYIELVVHLIKERATFVHDFWELSHFFFTAPKEFDSKALKKAIKDDTKSLLEELLPIIEAISDFDKEIIQNTVKSWITSKEIGFGKIMMPFRVALVGALSGPDVFDISFMIGKQETINRLNHLISSI